MINTHNYDTTRFCSLQCVVSVRLWLTAILSTDTPIWLRITRVSRSAKWNWPTCQSSFNKIASHLWPYLGKQPRTSTFCFFCEHLICCHLTYLAHCPKSQLHHQIGKLYLEFYFGSKKTAFLDKSSKGIDIFLDFFEPKWNPCCW